MQLNLKRPIAFFDLETTGTNIAKDRIVEIGMIIVNTDNTTKEYRFLVNPTIPIPKEASLIHGIYDKDVENEATFKELAPRLYRIFDACDLAGYNSNYFDVPLLVEEFLRVGYNLNIKNRNLLDAFSIFTMFERRDLGSAYKFFCNKTLENAHSAIYDVRATFEVFKAQIERYDELENDMNFIADLTNRNKNSLDNANRFVLIDEIPCFNFGKYKGIAIEKVLKENPGYYSWIMQGDFPLNTKQVLTDIKKSITKLQ